MSNPVMVTDYGVWSSVSLAASATATSETVQLKAKKGGVVFVTVTKGATPPSDYVGVKLFGSNDETLWAHIGTELESEVDGSAVASDVIEIPVGVEFVRLVATGDTAQTVTLNAKIAGVN